MDLNSEIFTGIVAGLRLRGRERDWTDRRRSTRIPLQKCLAIIPYKAGVPTDPVYVWVRDISAGGIGLVYAHAMSPGDEFAVRLPHIDGSEIALLCATSYCFGMGTDLYSIGARFVRTLPEYSAVATPAASAPAC